MAEAVAGDFLSLAAPARRALEGAGIRTLADLGGMTEADVAALHGIGADAMRRLKAAMAEQCIRFMEQEG